MTNNLLMATTNNFEIAPKICLLFVSTVKQTLSNKKVLQAKCNFLCA